MRGIHACDESPNHHRVTGNLQLEILHVDKTDSAQWEANLSTIRSTKILSLHIVALQPGQLLHIVTPLCRGSCLARQFALYSRHEGPNNTLRSPNNAGFGVTLYCGPTRIISIVRLPTSLIFTSRSEEHTSELQSRFDLVCRLL